ncbi:hypothetical protein AK830_g11364 [Neonectria ditissima]|uniref:Ubiquitin-like protease family profile domain-containing protein n=1 Tax=Neonectria ditissima TaxID=78410 RepID=A0A0P7B1K9_9HYPO|nr:hypothetical protein AK830_g11364 [Neonectria ditissima]
MQLRQALRLPTQSDNQQNLQARSGTRPVAFVFPCRSIPSSLVLSFPDTAAQPRRLGLSTDSPIHGSALRVPQKPTTAATRLFTRRRGSSNSETWSATLKITLRRTRGGPGLHGSACEPKSCPASILTLLNLAVHSHDTTPTPTPFQIMGRLSDHTLAGWCVTLALKDVRTDLGKSKTQPKQNTEKRSDPSFERPAKRQKQHDEVRSPFFPLKPSQKPRNDSIENSSEDEPRKKPTPEFHDLTQDGSQADTIDFASTTSTGKPSATSGLPEYRNSMPKNLSANRRIRRSRGPNPKISSQNGDVSISSVDHIANVAAFSGTSPDVLGRDPSPARIVSDILPYSPKLVITDQPKTKRMRLSAERRSTDVDSEDELAKPGLHVHQPLGKKANNFSGISRPGKHRGDISRTQFMPSKPGTKGRKAASKPPAMHDVSIVSAASGRSQYPLPNQREHIINLHFEESVAEASYVTGGMTRRLAWLDIHRAKVQSMYHSATHSRFVVIKRSTTNDSPGGGNLVIQFKDIEHVPAFMCWLCATSAIKPTEKSPGDLEKQFDNVFKETRKYIDSLGTNPTTAKLPASSPPDKGQLRSRVPTLLRDPFYPPTEKLKDKMQGPIAEVPELPGREDDSTSVVTRSQRPETQRPETQRTRRASPPPLLSEKTPDRWTSLNPDWDKYWHRSLVYPATGKDRATVDRDDILRLDEGEFLNDNLISFYFRYLQVGLQRERPEILQKVHFFNTFFFAKLRSTRGNINYDGVKSWTARVDLLSYKYIVVPVNENMHWYLAIIYNAPRMLAEGLEREASAGTDAIDVEEPATVTTPKTSPVERAFETISLDDGVTKQTAVSQSSSGTIDIPAPSSPTQPSNGTTFKGSKRKSLGGAQRFSPEEPKIITLDSLGGGHSVTCRHLKDYLVEEARHKKNIDLVKIPGGMTAKKIPEQDNYCDCGVFLLGYMEEFLKDPDEAVRRILQKEELEWNIQPSRIRAKVRDLVFNLQSEQEARLEKEKERRRLRKIKDPAMSSGPSAAPSSQSSPREPPPSSKTPPVKPWASSPLRNNVGSKAVLALQQVMAIPPSPRTSSSPIKPVRHGTPRFDEVPQFIHPLEVDLGTKSSLSGGEAVQSARSSPQGGSQVPVDLTTETPTNSIPSPSKQRSEPIFIQKLSSSPLIAHSPTAERRGLKRDRPISPEVTFISAGTTKPGIVQPHNLQPSQDVLPSIESDRSTTSGPQYDGIDRSHRIPS